LQYVKYAKGINIAKEIATFYDFMVCFGQEVKTHQKKRQYKNPCQGQESNAGPLVLKSDGQRDS